MIGSVRITKMTIIMFTPQVPKEFISIKIPAITVLAKRVPPMGFIIRVTLPPVQTQLLSRIAAPLKRKDVQVFRTQVAVKEFMFTAYMILERIE